MGNETATEILANSFQLPPVQRVAALGRAIDLADAEGDLDLGFRCRSRLVDATYYVPGSVELLSSYSWLVARHDDDPQRFPLDLWSYKWVVNALPALASVSLDQIDRVLEDLERRFEANGQSGAPAAKLRMTVLIDTRRHSLVEEAYDAWELQLRERRGYLNDCRACDEAERVRALLSVGREADALEAAADLIAKRSSCMTEPHYTLPSLIGPARRLGQGKLADVLRKRGYGLIHEDAKFLDVVGFFIRDSLENDDTDRAVELVARHRAWSTDFAQNDAAKWRFAAAARAALLRLEQLKQPVPSGLADLKAGGRSATDIASLLIGQAEDLGAAFDERNGNSWHADRLADDRALALR